MWNKVARFIIQNRLFLILVIGIITMFMGYYASKVQMSYDFARAVPPGDPDMIALEQFRAQFGEDGNIIAIGLKDSAIFEQRNFEAYRSLSRNLKQISGVSEVISLPVMKMILKDTENSRFYLANIFPDKIKSKELYDSLLAITRNQRFYMDQLVNEKNGATMTIVT